MRRISVEFDDEDNTITAYYEEDYCDGTITGEITLDIDDIFPRYREPVLNHKLSTSGRSAITYAKPLNVLEYSSGISRNFHIL